MKILVLGCNGMAGHTISLYLQEQGYDVVGFDRRKSNIVDSVVGDAEDKSLLSDLIINGHFNVIINCIGLLNQFAEQNKALAVYLNSYLPHYIAKITEETDIQVLHMSTDCVFSGKKGGYAANDFKDGESFYDRTKAMGELDDSKNITLRNSIIGPDINPNGIGLFNWFMKQKGEINGYTKSMWTGQTTLQLAKTMEYAFINKISGLYNAVPENNISKYELIKKFNHYFRNDELTIKPVEGVNADKTLIASHFNNYTIPSYDVMIKDMAKWILDHKELYPHYCL